jgi:hypothetical protein
MTFEPRGRRVEIAHDEDHVIERRRVRAGRVAGLTRPGVYERGE